MENQLQFQKKLAALLERAQSQGMRVTKEQIREHFAGSGLNEEQMLLVYDYLFSQKIVVAGYMENATVASKSDGAGQSEGAAENADAGQVSGVKAADEAQYSQEEMEYLQNYERDLKAMKAEMPGERETLFSEAAVGDALAKSRLIELYLPVVLEIAKQMHRSGCHIGDMVQEGNVSLLLALDMLADSETWNAPDDVTDMAVPADSAGQGNQALRADDRAGQSNQAQRADDRAGQSDQVQRADAFLREEIRLGIRAMQEEQEELGRRDRKIEQSVNDLDEALHRVADEKGRAVTLDELAEYVQMTKEEILDIIKLAGEDLYEKFHDSDKG